jgi:hypothetical protein
MSPLVTILEPIAEPSETRRELAARPPTLGGCKVGLLDNSQINAEVFMRRLGDLLVEHCQAGSARSWRKPFWTRPAPSELIAEVAASCDLVVVGWGS